MPFPLRDGIAGNTDPRPDKYRPHRRTLADVARMPETDREALKAWAARYRKPRTAK